MRRFLSVDPVIGGTLNPYVYVGDPINDSDYSGKFSFWNLRDWMRKLATPAKIGQGVRSVASGAWNYVRNNPAEVGSMIPGFGTPFDLFLAGREAKRGNTAGTALNLIGLIPVAGDIAKGGGKAARWASKTDNILDGTRYSAHVSQKISNSNDLYHTFPKLVDQLGAAGKIVPVNSADGLGHTRIGLHVTGSINGVEGTFQYIIEANGEISHRVFMKNF